MKAVDLQLREVDINLNGFPRGTKTTAQAEGLCGEVQFESRSPKQVE